MSDNWQPIETAPKTTTSIRGKTRDGTIIEDMHYASDLSGEDQPPFQGWFRPTVDADSYIQVDPVMWMPKKVSTARYNVANYGTAMRERIMKDLNDEIQKLKGTSKKEQGKND